MNWDPLIINGDVIHGGIFGISVIYWLHYHLLLFTMW